MASRSSPSTRRQATELSDHPRAGSPARFRGKTYYRSRPILDTNEVLMGYPVVHFEINTASRPKLSSFYAEAFGWSMQPETDDYIQISTNGVCAGTGAPGIDGGIGPSEPGDDFVTFYVQVPDVEAMLAQVVELGGEVDMPPTQAGRVVFAIARDPAGNRIGLVDAEPVNQSS